jgi:hypothetical protein
MSGMRINFNKSDLIPINVSIEESNTLAQVFGCKICDFPIKYLGVPLHFSKLRKEDLQPLIDAIIKRIAGWRGRLLSHASMLVLIRSCLASIPNYLLSVIKFPKWAIRVHWEAIFATLAARGFPEWWIWWVKHLLET